MLFVSLTNNNNINNKPFEKSIKYCKVKFERKKKEICF